VPKNVWGDLPPDLSPIGDSLENALDGSGRHADRVIQAQVAFQKGPYAWGERDDAPLRF
jgi:hypothetical protein